MPARTQPTEGLGLLVIFRRAGEIPREWRAFSGTEALQYAREMLLAMDELKDGDRLEVTSAPDDLGEPEISRSSHYS